MGNSYLLKILLKKEGNHLYRNADNFLTNDFKKKLMTQKQPNLT